MFYFSKEKEIKKIISEKINASNEILICVAFITKNGWDDLFSGLDEKEISAKKIKVITTTENFITDYAILDYLLKNNIKTKILREQNESPEIKSMHNKFFIFDKSEAINGSLNLTYNALNRKYEAITISSENINKYLEAFEYLWSDQISENLDKHTLEIYKNEYEKANDERKEFNKEIKSLDKEFSLLKNKRKSNSRDKFSYVDKILLIYDSLGINLDFTANEIKSIFNDKKCYINTPVRDLGNELNSNCKNNKSTNKISFLKGKNYFYREKIGSTFKYKLSDEGKERINFLKK